MSVTRLKQISAGNSILRVIGGLSIALLAAGGCVKKASDVPKPDNMMVKMETDPDLRLRELQRESADFTTLVHTLPDNSALEERSKIRQAFGTLTQLLPLVQVGPKGGVFSHQVSVVADTQTLLSGSSSDLSAVPIIDRGLRAVYNALDDAQHNSSVYYEDTALRGTLDQLSAKINEFDTARGALHNAAWADAFLLTSTAISRMTDILAERLTEGPTSIPTTTPTESGPSTTPPAAAPTTGPMEPATAPPPANPTTTPTEPVTTPPPVPTAPTEPAAPPPPPPATGPTTGPGGSPEGPMGRVHEELSGIGEAVGGLSKEQQDKLALLEQGLAPKVNANPDVVRTPTFFDDVLKQFREILTTDQQGKFDKMMAEQAVRAVAMKTANSLRQIGLASLMYANDHANLLPPDLGTLVSPTLGPEIFLAADSKTQVPADLAAQDVKKQAAWVNANTDFVYLGAGKDSSKLAGTFVVAYQKTGDSQSFLLSDGTVHTSNAEQAAKIITELQAGTNPPPSLPQ